MPQSTNVTANQMRNIPDQAAEAAAASRDHETHLSPHEETVRAQEEKHNHAPTGHNTVHDSALHHGKAAADAAKH